MLVMWMQLSGYELKVESSTSEGGRRGGKEGSTARGCCGCYQCHDGELKVQIQFESIIESRRREVFRANHELVVIVRRQQHQASKNKAACKPQ